MFPFLLFAFVILGGMYLLDWLTFTRNPGQVSVNLELQRVVDDALSFLEGVWSRLSGRNRQWDLVDSTETERLTRG